MALAVNRALVGDTQHWLFCLNHPELHFAPTPLSHWQETMAPLHRSTGHKQYRNYNKLTLVDSWKPLVVFSCRLCWECTSSRLPRTRRTWNKDLNEGWVDPVKGIQVWSLRKRYLQAKSSSIKHKRMHSARSSMLFTCDKNVVVFRQLCFWKLQFFYFYFLTVLWSKPSKWPPTTLSTALKMIVIYFYSLSHLPLMKWGGLNEHNFAKVL